MFFDILLAFMNFFLATPHYHTCEILIPRPDMEPCTLHWKQTRGMGGKAIWCIWLEQSLFPVITWKRISNLLFSYKIVPDFATPWTVACQASLLFTISRSWWCHPTILSVTPFSSCPQSFPASWSFPMSWLFVSCGQSIRASASVLPMNIQGSLVQIKLPLFFFFNYLFNFHSFNL